MLATRLVSDGGGDCGNELSSTTCRERKAASRRILLFTWIFRIVDPCLIGCNVMECRSSLMLFPSYAFGTD